MAQRDTADIVSALLSKGFYRKNNDHIFFYYKENQSIYTKISHGSGYKVYSDKLLGKVKRQLNLTTKELLEFIDCPLTKEKYKELLKSKELIK
jgi:hypothetical protein